MERNNCRVIASCLLIATCGFPTLGADRSWDGGAGDWNVGTNWNSPDTVPASTDRAFVNNGGTATMLTGNTVINVRSGIATSSNASGTIIIGDTSNAPLLVNTHTDATQLRVGYATSSALTGTGTFMLNNGTVRLSNANGGQVVVGDANSSTGTARGYFEQNGGILELLGVTTTDSRGQVQVGIRNGVGTFVLNGGSITSIWASGGDTAGGRLLVGGSGGSGTFILSGGTAQFPNRLSVGQDTNSKGVISQNGGVMNTGTMFLGRNNGTGTYNVTGGTVNATTSAMRVGFGDGTTSPGNNGTGYLNINGGTLVASSDIRVASAGGGGTGATAATGQGTITVSSGRLESLTQISFHQNENAGFSGTLRPAVIEQTGGLVTAPNLNKVLNGGNATYNLSGGVLRVNTVTLRDATFTWGAGTVGLRSTTGLSGGTDFSNNAQGPSVMVGSTLNWSSTSSVVAGAGSTLEVGGLYINSGTRFNNAVFSTGLNLAGSGDTLAFGTLNPYFLRPNGLSLAEFGSLPLVVSSTASITGVFDTYQGIINDNLGWSLYTGAFSNASSLPLNSYYFEYADNVVNPVGFAAGTYDILYLHYNVAGSVPEPGSFALLSAGALVLRLGSRLGSLRRRL